MGNKEYLGDSVYVDCDARGLILTTENGTGNASNTIVLEPPVLDALMHYVTKMGEAKEE